MEQTVVGKGTERQRASPKHPGGAPKKKIRKDRSVRVRLSATEYLLAQTKARSAGMRISDLVRASLRNAKVVPRWSPKDQQTLNVLRGMADNLNQMTRAANSGGLLLVARKCMTLLDEVNKAIEYLYRDDSEDT